ncbi:MAG TPA: hypothetical protein VK525_16885 [Candidatus Saccharimonadales bacterium]|nr:hypothetical protein [Candidatus Saccharimonadales bacterium]
MQAQTASAVQYSAFQDKEIASDWRVEATDIKAGDVYVTVFSGPLAQERAIEYAEFKNKK